MDSRQIARFKKRLLAERKRIVEERDAQLPDGASSRQTTLPRVDQPDDLSDDAARYSDRGRISLATANIDRILAKIDRALQKIEEGSYGLSDVDRSPIPLERLNVLPYALTTVGQEEPI